MKSAIFEEHSSSCVVYFRFSGTLFPVSMIDGDHVKKEILASKSIFHSFHAVLWSMDHTHKNDIPMHLGQVLK